MWLLMVLASWSESIQQTINVLADNLPLIGGGFLGLFILYSLITRKAENWKAFLFVGLFFVLLFVIFEILKNISLPGVP